MSENSFGDANQHGNEAAPELAAFPGFPLLLILLSRWAAQLVAHPYALILPSVPACAAIFLPRAVFYDFFISVSRGPRVCQPSHDRIRAEEGPHCPRSHKDSVRSGASVQGPRHEIVNSPPSGRHEGEPKPYAPPPFFRRRASCRSRKLCASAPERLGRPHFLLPIDQGERRDEFSFLAHG